MQSSKSQQETIQVLQRRYLEKLDIATHRKQENDTQSAKDCIELAEVLEQLYAQQSNPLIGQICSKITRDYKDKGVRNWSHVPDYLPDKYKRDYDSSAREISQGANMLSNNLLSLQNVDLKNIPIDTKQKAFDILCRFTDNIEKDAQEEHYALFKPNDSILDNFNTQYQDRKDITTPKPEPKETELSDAIQETIDALTELKKDAIEFPPAYKQEAKIYSKGWQSFAKIIRWCTDDKFSLHPAEWLNKESYRQFQGKHAPPSGRKQKPFSVLPVQRTWTMTLKPTKLCMQTTTVLAVGNVSNAKAMKAYSGA